MCQLNKNTYTTHHSLSIVHIECRQFQSKLYDGIQLHVSSILFPSAGSLSPILFEGHEVENRQYMLSFKDQNGHNFQMGLQCDTCETGARAAW